MVEPIPLLTFLVALLIAGIAASLLAKRLRIPETLMLLVGGITFGIGHRAIGSPISLPPIFLVAIALMALSVVVCTSSARLKLWELDHYSIRAIEVVLAQTLLILVVVTGAGVWLFRLTIPQALVLSSLLIGTSPAVILTALESAKHKAISLLKLESIINSPLTVLLPFIIIDIVSGIHPGVTRAIVAQSIPFAAKFVSGVGAGIVMAVIVMKIARMWYSRLYSPMILLCSSLSTYTLAENLGGNGVLAVATFGIFLGQVRIREKEKLFSFEGILSKMLYIFVFMLIGTVSVLRTESWFLVNVLLFSFIYLVCRFLCMYAVLRAEYSLKEIFFMALTNAKGIATVTATFSLLAAQIFDISIVLDIVLWFILMSITFSAIVGHFAKFFIGKEIPTAKKA